MVEGLIGVGKTTLVHRLAERLGGRAVLEAFEDNPFLPSFYRDPEGHALATQLFFLMSRFRQQEQLAQTELFSAATVADYLFDKDRLFAELTLCPSELTLYDQLFSTLAPQVPAPDLVIHLVADVDEVLRRIAARGRGYEQSITRRYLQDLDQAYRRFFARYTAAPVWTLDTSGVDLRDDGPAFSEVLDAARTGALPAPAQNLTLPGLGELPG